MGNRISDIVGRDASGGSVVGRHNWPVDPDSSVRTTSSIFITTLNRGFGFRGSSGACASVRPCPTIGAAAGSAVAGFLIDGVGPQGAYVAAAAFAVVGVLVAVVFVRGFPDLRGRDASPLPDTEPVSTIL